MGDYIYMVQMDVTEDMEDEFNRIYDTQHVPYLLQVPGVHGCARYKLEQTNAEGMARYVAIYELESLHLPSTEAWEKAAEKGDWVTKIRPHTFNRSHSIFKKIR